MQVSKWLRNFESKRHVVERRPPSYLTPPQNDELLEEQTGEQLDTEDMIAFDSDRLDLSALPTRKSRRDSAA